MKSLRKDIFAKCVPVKEKLLSFGFTEEKGNLVLLRHVPEMDVDLTLTINGDDAEFEACDHESGEEFLNVLSPTLRGKEEELLDEIREKCTVPLLFRSAQANRISGKILALYGVSPEFLFRDLPSYAVYRRKENGKWFAVLMDVPYEKFLPKKEGTVNFVNLKSASLEEDIGRDGVYRGWHMNKKSWISVFLDDTLKDEEILSFIEASYRLVK